MQVESGSSSTRPAWALAFGLPAAEPEDLRPPRPRSRLARASTLPGSPRPAAPRNFPDAGTLLLASVEPAGPVPSGAHSVASERLVRRALGREAANAKVTSKKSKFGWEVCKQHTGGPLRLSCEVSHCTLRQSCSFPKSCACTEIQRNVQTCCKLRTSDRE